MTKQYSPRRVVKPGTAGIKALLTTTSIAAALGGWALFASHEAALETLPAQQTVEMSPTRQAFTLDAKDLPTIAALPTLVPGPPDIAGIGIGTGIITQVEPPTQVPTAVQANLLRVPQAPQAPRQSLRTVNPPAVVSRKAAPIATTRSSR